MPHLERLCKFVQDSEGGVVANEATYSELVGALLTALSGPSAICIVAHCEGGR